MTGKTKYTRLIADLNGYDIRSWLIADGMGFQSLSKWWAQGTRNVPHNGIDLRGYTTSDGRIKELDTETLIPALADGTIVAVIKDFLGQTIFVEHMAHDGGRLISAYGHLAPHEDCIRGRKVKAGQAIATLAASLPVPAHLHLSMTVLPIEFEISSLTWQELDAHATFLDPAHWL